MNTKTEKDLNKARKLIEDNKKFIPKFQKFDRIYPFTNENIKEIFSLFNFTNKNILSILGSSDQTLDICLQGAKNITTFDINPLSEYYFYLKKAALLANISLKDYIDFFKYYDNKTKTINKNTFNIKTFSRLAQYLPYEKYIFWAKLFNEYSPSEIRASNGLFSTFKDELEKDILKQTISYLNNENSFNELKEKIQNLNFTFVESDIKDIIDKTNSKYDFIYLSNIIQYIDEIYENIIKNKEDNQIYKLKKFKELIIELSQHLNSNGKIIAGYIYNINDDIKNISVYNKEKRNKIFNEDDFYYHNIKSIKMLIQNCNYKKNKPTEDACMIYCKK